MFIVIGWIIAGIVLAIVLGIILSELEVKLHMRRVREDDNLIIRFRWLYGLVRYSIEIPSMRWKGRRGLELKQKHVNDRKDQVLNEMKPRIDGELIMKDYRKLMTLLRSTFELSRWFKETLKHVRCHELNWHTQLGAGDAVETATVTGLAWSLKGSLIGFLSNYIKLSVQPRLHITPYYNESKFAMQLDCIFKIRTGYAIVAGMLLLMRILRIKGGMRVWRNILFKAS